MSVALGSCQLKYMFGRDWTSIWLVFCESERMLGSFSCRIVARFRHEIRFCLSLWSCVSFLRKFCIPRLCWTFFPVWFSVWYSYLSNGFAAGHLLLACGATVEKATAHFAIVHSKTCAAVLSWCLDLSCCDMAVDLSLAIWTLVRIQL